MVFSGGVHRTSPWPPCRPSEQWESGKLVPLEPSSSDGSTLNFQKSIELRGELGVRASRLHARASSSYAALPWSSPASVLSCSASAARSRQCWVAGATSPRHCASLHPRDSIAYWGQGSTRKLFRCG